MPAAVCHSGSQASSLLAPSGRLLAAWAAGVLASWAIPCRAQDAAIPALPSVEAPSGNGLGLRFNALVGLHLPLERGLRSPDGAIFAAEAGANFWPDLRRPFFLGAYARAEAITGLSVGHLSFNLHLGSGSLDNRWAPWPRAGDAVSAFGGVVDANGAPGWRAGLAGHVPFGGFFRLIGRTPGEGLEWLHPGERDAGPFITVLRLAIAIIVTAGVLFALANEVELSVETVYPRGLAPTTAANIMLGFAF